MRAAAADTLDTVGQLIPVFLNDIAKVWLIYVHNNLIYDNLMIHLGYTGPKGHLI